MLNKLSKEVSYALRHSPEKYNLKLDEYGFVYIEDLLKALNNIDKWKNIKKEDLVIMIDKSDKKRFEIVDNKIRAFYGHSVPIKILKEEKIPPKILYHGTSKEAFNIIEEEGLLPKSRQYVHLSQDIETAKLVAKRHSKNIIVILIDTEKAIKDGIKFYYGNDKVWLVDSLLPKYFLEI